MGLKAGSLFQAFLLLAMSLLPNHGTEAQESTSSPLGAYGSMSTYCGKGSITENVVTIPWIGCFSLSAGHRASGVLSGQHVEIAVDSNGQEIFTVNGSVVTGTFGPNRTPSGTNLPFVRVSGAGYSFCEDQTTAHCAIDVSIFSRDPDKSVHFMVAECFPPPGRLCVLNQKNWDYEKSRLPHTATQPH